MNAPLTTPAEVVIEYTNWKGLRRERRIDPSAVVEPDKRFWFGATAYHPRPQWLLTARDLDTGEMRTFAMESIHSWRPA